MKYRVTFDRYDSPFLTFLSFLKTFVGFLFWVAGLSIPLFLFLYNLNLDDSTYGGLSGIFAIAIIVSYFIFFFTFNIDEYEKKLNAQSNESNIKKHPLEGIRVQINGIWHDVTASSQCLDPDLIRIADGEGIVNGDTIIFRGHRLVKKDDRYYLIEKTEPCKKTYISSSQEEKEYTTPPIGSLLAAIDLTLMALDDAFAKKSKHINKKATAKLDYSIYLFFKNYCLLCNTQNETLVTYYIQFAFDRLIEHFSSIMSENKVKQIIDDRITEYDHIIQTSNNFVEDITYAIEQHLIKDLYFQNSENESIAIAGANTQFEITVELALLNDHIAYKINHIYDNLISEWNKNI